MSLTHTELHQLIAVLLDLLLRIGSEEIKTMSRAVILTQYHSTLNTMQFLGGPFSSTSPTWGVALPLKSADRLVAAFHHLLCPTMLPKG